MEQLAYDPVALRIAVEKLKEYVLSDNPDDEGPFLRFLDGKEDFLRTVVNPIWKKIAFDANHVRFMDVRATFDLVCERREKSLHKISLYDNGASYAGVITYLLRQRADGHEQGVEARIGALGSKEQPDEDLLTWVTNGATLAEPQSSLKAQTTSVSIAPEMRYVFALPTEDDAYPPFSLSYSFANAATLREAMKHVEERRKEMLEAKHITQKVQENLHFREHLLSMAVYQYEVFGYVMDEWMPSRPPISENVVDIIRYGLGLAQDLSFKSRSQLLDQIAQDKPRWGVRTRLARILKRHAFYRQGKRRGRSSNPKEELEHMLASWREALDRLDAP